jgi:hypothetical protein
MLVIRREQPRDGRLLVKALAGGPGAVTIAW